MCGRHGAPRLGLPLLGFGLLLSLAATECGAAGLRRAAPGRRRGLKTQRKVRHHDSVKASSGGGDNRGRNKRINTLAKKIQSNIQGGRDPRLDLVQDYIWPDRARIDTKHKDEVSFLEDKKLSRMDPWAPSPAFQGSDFLPPRVPPPRLTSAPAPSVSGQWDYGPEDQASMWAPSPYTGEPSGTPWGETLNVHKSSVHKSAERSHTKSRSNQVHAERTGQDDKQPGFGQPSFGPPGISAIPPPDGTSGLAPGLGNGLASMIMADPNQKPPVANRFQGGLSPGYPAYPAFPPPPGFGPYGYPAPWWALEPTLPPIRIPPGWPQPPADPLKEPPWGGPSPNPRIGRRQRRRRERERERDERRLFRGGPPEYLYPDYGRPGYDFPSYRYPDYGGPIPWYAYSPTLPPIRIPRGIPFPPRDPIGQPPVGGPSPAGWMEPTLPPIRIPSGLPSPPRNPLTRPPIGGPSPASWGGLGPSMLGDPYDPYDPYSGGYGMGAYSNKDGPSGEGGFYPPDSPSMVYSAVAQGAATAAQANAEEAAKQAMDSLVKKGLYGGYSPQ